MITEVKSILLAEDSPQDIELTLEALGEYNLANHIAIVKDGQEALDFLYYRGGYQTRPKGYPAVFLLDIKMPKISGLEVLRIIKGDENLKQIPVVILTSSQEETDLIESYKLGVNAYVVKPVHFPDFIEAVKSLGIFWALVNEPPLGSIKVKS